MIESSNLPALANGGFYGRQFFILQFGKLFASILSESPLVLQSRVIARGNHIRDVKRLVAQYGGRASKWVKKSSPEFEVAGKYFEYHWYEHSGIGRFEVKEVRIKKS